MAHELAGALQQVGRIPQLRAVKEPYVTWKVNTLTHRPDMQPDSRHARSHDSVPTFPHHFKPPMRDDSQFVAVLFHPGIDGGIPFDTTIESQQFRSHCRFIFAFGCMLRDIQHEDRRESH
jgi:hypothetical protein